MICTGESSSQPTELPSDIVTMLTLSCRARVKAVTSCERQCQLGKYLTRMVGLTTSSVVAPEQLMTWRSAERHQSV